MPGMDSIGGCVRPFSQCNTVSGVTPSCSATCFCVRPRASRLLRTCSPMVWGSSTKGCGFKALRVTSMPGKKATRPCPCGYHGDPRGRCRCTAEQVRRYRNRISGPLLDRIDLQIEVPALPAEALQKRSGRRSVGGRSGRVTLARERADKATGKSQRAFDEPGNRPVLPARSGRCRPAETRHQARFDLSARAYHRLLKVARTIADITGVGTSSRRSMLLRPCSTVG
jgi:magnesium chelatase family protein